MAEEKQAPAVEEVKQPTVKDRVTNPLFIAAAASFAYTTYTKLALLYGWATLDEGTFQVFVDLVAYVILGTGVYSVFGAKKIEK